MTIGDRIKARRIELNLKVDDLAKRINKNRSTIYRYEHNDITDLSTTTLKLLAKALCTTPEVLLGYSNEQNTYDNPTFIGQNIKQYRLLKNMTADELCSKAKIPLETLNLYENAEEDQIDLPIVTKIAEALDLDILHIRGYMDPVIVCNPDGTPRSPTNRFAYKFYPRLAGLLKVKGIKKEKFAQDIHITTEKIESWKLAQSRPTPDLIEKISNYFQVDVSFLSSDMLSFAYPYIPQKISIESLKCFDMSKDNIPKIRIPYNFLGEYDANENIVFMYANADMEPIIKKGSMIAVLQNLSLNQLSRDDIVIFLYKDNLALRRLKNCRKEDPVWTFFPENSAAEPIFFSPPAENNPPPTNSIDNPLLFGKVVMYCTAL